MREWTAVQILSNNLIHQLNLGQLEVWHGNTLGNLNDLVLYFGGTTEDFMARVTKEKKKKDQTTAQQAVLSPVEDLEDPSQNVSPDPEQEKTTKPQQPIQRDLFD